MNNMINKEIYEQLKEGVKPSYIDGLRHFDTSEVIQWMISYHQEVNAELLEALQGFVDLFPDVIDGDAIMLALDMAEAAIKKALGDQND